MAGCVCTHVCYCCFGSLQAWLYVHQLGQLLDGLRKKAHQPAMQQAAAAVQGQQGHRHIPGTGTADDPYGAGWLSVEDRTRAIRILQVQFSMHFSVWVVQFQGLLLIFSGLPHAGAVMIPSVLVRLRRNVVADVGRKAACCKLLGTTQCAMRCTH